MRSAIRNLILFSGGVNLNFTDDFARADGALGNGWLGGATWAISSNKAINTPSGSSVINDGAVENWNSATDLTSWGESLAGTSSVNREAVVVHSGSFAARLDVDGSGSAVNINSTGTAGAVVGFKEMAAWLQSNPTAKACSLQTAGRTITVTASYVKYYDTLWSSNTSPQLIFRTTATSSSLYGDDFSLITIPLSEALNLRSYPSADVDCGATIGWPTLGMRGGVGICWDSPSAPKYGLVAWGDGVNLRLSKVVNGVLTDLITNPITNSGTTIVEIRKTGATVSLWYKGTQVGSNQDLSAETGIINNLYHGILATNPLVTIDDFFAHP